MPEKIPVLMPMTPEARNGLQHEYIELRFFPFRIGRESRFRKKGGKWFLLERRHGQAAANNDYYIVDMGELLNMSREHFQIEKKPDGSYCITDRGSACGTIVDDKEIGGEDRTGCHPLNDGSIIKIGTQQSPLVYRFQLSKDSTPES